jgi:hypothetical protein
MSLPFRSMTTCATPKSRLDPMETEGLCNLHHPYHGFVLLYAHGFMCLAFVVRNECLHLGSTVIFNPALLKKL